MKDNFSAQANLYALFRPTYPQQVFDFIYRQVKGFDRALDCATGNGQVAAVLADKFREVHATDISEKQLANAARKEAIFYKVEAAEDTAFPDAHFDLVTVAQAVHWFKFEEFYSEVRRILKPGGVLAVIGYGNLSVNEAVKPWLSHFYRDIAGPYWDSERRYIDEGYRTIPFDLPEIETPSLVMEYEWSREQFIGYLETWSSVLHFIKANGVHPLTEQLLKQLEAVWPAGTKYTVQFPLLLRVGVNK